MAATEIIMCGKHGLFYGECFRNKSGECYFCMVERLEAELPEPLRTWVKELNKELALAAEGKPTGG